MSEKLALIVGTPTVIGTNIGKFGEVLIKAEDTPGGSGISVHYQLSSEEGVPPAVREKLLVAIVEGTYPQWFEDDYPGHEMADITYEADSANGNDNAMRLESVPTGDASRLMLTTWLRDVPLGAPKHDIILTQGQVMNLIMTLLALYPRLHEAGDA